MKYINLHKLKKDYTLSNISYPGLLELSAPIPLKKITAVVGRSGCGKTTLLHLLAGLLEPSGGSVCIHDSQTKTKIPFAPVKQGMVFQDSRLFPWLTVKQNMCFSQRGGAHITNGTVEKYLQMLGLKTLQDFYPHQLSGGLAQRASLGRALCSGASILLMDEPTSSLDFFTQQNFQDNLYRIFKEEEKTIILVTHDLREAIKLSHQIICLSPTGNHNIFQNTLAEDERQFSPAAQKLEKDLLSALTK